MLVGLWLGRLAVRRAGGPGAAAPGGDAGPSGPLAQAPDTRRQARSRPTQAEPSPPKLGQRSLHLARAPPPPPLTGPVPTTFPTTDLMSSGSLSRGRGPPSRSATYDDYYYAGPGEQSRAHLAQQAHHLNQHNHQGGYNQPVGSGRPRPGSGEVVTGGKSNRGCNR